MQFNLIRSIKGLFILPVECKKVDKKIKLFEVLNAVMKGRR